MRYFIDNSDWLTDQLDEYPDDEYFLIDCPGQIELYSHVPVMRKFVDTLKLLDIAVMGVSAAASDLNHWFHSRCTVTGFEQRAAYISPQSTSSLFILY